MISLAQRTTNRRRISAMPRCCSSAKQSRWRHPLCTRPPLLSDTGSHEAVRARHARAGMKAGLGPCGTWHLLVATSRAAQTRAHGSLTVPVPDAVVQGVACPRWVGTYCASVLAGHTRASDRVRYRRRRVLLAVLWFDLIWTSRFSDVATKRSQSTCSHPSRPTTDGLRPRRGR